VAPAIRPGKLVMDRSHEPESCGKFEPGDSAAREGGAAPTRGRQAAFFYDSPLVLAGDQGSHLPIFCLIDLASRVTCVKNV
jgi:hypothetical protein